MSEAIETKETVADVVTKEKETEVQREIGDIYEEGGELFEVEAAEKETAKSTDEKVEDKEEVETKETIKSEEISKPSDAETVADPNTIRSVVMARKVKLLEEQIKESKLTPEQVRDRIPVKKLKQELLDEEKLLDEIDPDLNPSEHKTQKNIISAIKSAISEKEQTAQIEDRFKSKDNEDFLKNERKEFEDKGFKFSDVEWDAIATVSADYLDVGKYTKNAIQKGFIDIVGADVYNKMIAVSSEQKVREDIKAVATKVTKSVSTTSGKAAQSSNFMNKLLKITDQDELERQLSRLNAPQLAMYKRKISK